MEVLDSLPYIDAEPTEAERESAIKLINREIPKDYLQRPHPSLPAISEPSFSSLLQKELARCAAGHPFEGGINLSRYEAPDEPSKDASVDAWRASLVTAYASSTYLAGRRTNLGLLEESGKNAWLISNYLLEENLKTLDKDLKETERQTEEINKARKIAQEDSRGELMALQDSWREGIGKMIEVQIATQKLRVQNNR